MLFKKFYQLLKNSLYDWWKHNPLLIAGAISFFMLFSLAPLLVIITDAISLFFGSYLSDYRISKELSNFVGDRAAEVLKSIIIKGDDAPKNSLTLYISIPMVISGSLMIFMQVRNALNLIWKVKSNKEYKKEGFLKDYLYSFIMVIFFGFFILLLTIKSPVLYLIRDYISKIIAVPNYIINIVDFILTYIGITILFAAIYKILPQLEIKFLDVIYGAALTAFLFLLAQIIIGLYFEYTKIATAYGAMGSFTILFIWIFYSALVFVYGAVFTYNYAVKYGSLK